MDEEAGLRPTVDQLKALTHPVRVRMLTLLRLDGPATATTLAARLGLNTGATSYHLRQLARHGFIVDDESRGDGRERWWRSAHTSTIASSAGLSADDFETFDAYLRAVVTGYIQRLQEALDEWPLLPTEWREAGTFSDYWARLTPAQAKEAKARIEAVLTGLEDDPDGEVFSFQINAYPWPGRVGRAPGEQA
jgi:DNA-binding transcriptional ArsR family regulator